MAATIAITSYAEGYQVNSLSAKQLGMGHVGTALKLNCESLFFNPAAITFQKTKFDFSIGMAGISPSSTYATLNDYSGATPSISKSKKGMSTPMYAYFTYKATEDLAIGVALNTPFGSSLDWGHNWAGAHLVQDINLQSFSLQPTISYKFWDKVSVGVGLSISWGNFDLSRSMLPVGENTNKLLAAMLQKNPGAASVITAAGDNALVSARLDGDAKIAYGFNIGVMYDICEEWTVGMSYRSKTEMTVNEGAAKLNYLNDNVKGVLTAIPDLIPELEKGTFTASLPAPSTLSFGASFRPTQKWELAVDLQWVGWSAYENLNVKFNESELKLADINSVKNYDNTFMFRVGGQYHVNEFLTARMGMYVDESPVRSDFMNPETPSMTKISYTGGLTINPTKFMSIDLSYGYIGSADPERTGTYPYFDNLTYVVMKNGAMVGGMPEAQADKMAKEAANQPFSGNYSVSAHMFSIGLSFRF